MRLTLKAKTTFLILVIAIIFSGTSITISNGIITRVVDSNYREKAENLARTVAMMVDNNAAAKLKADIHDVYINTPVKVTSDDWGSDAFNHYIERFGVIQKGRVYKSLYNTLHFALIANRVDSVYLLFVEPKFKHCVYMLDASEDPCPPGCIDSLTINTDNLRVIEHPEIGFPPYITNTKEYGWLVTAGAPLYDKDGDVLCYAMVDISMEEVRRLKVNFTLSLALVLLTLTIIICVIAIIIVNHTLTKPISMISNAAVQYCHEATDAEQDGFSKLDIRTGDEIEELSESMKQMEHDLNNHIRTILDTTHELTLTRKKADEMTALAHKDGLTGLRNKVAYDKEVLRLQNSIDNGKAAFGIAMIDLNFLKKINDSFGHDKGNIAIRTLCRIVCDIYDHSPVFRIGGDEFVVILENSDLQNSAELEGIFKNHIAELQKNLALSTWERVSAAIGIAIFDPAGDKTVEDVFKRADNLMYENKRAVKGNRLV